MANQIDLKGRVAVVTGAARGFGYAIAERFLESGAAVALWDMDKAALAKAARALAQKGKVDHVSLDVTDETAVEDAVAQTVRHLGPVDILVNNAGIAGPNRKTWEYTPGEFRRIVDVNLASAYICAAALVPDMKARGYGRVINISSVAGKEGNPNAAPYSVSKAALIALTKSLAKELADTNVLVNCVTPAAGNTEILKQMTQEHVNYMISKIPMGRLVEPQEVAALVAWLASSECSFSTGATFDISGGRSTY
jgi:NAD(P)-dependent dehydrogenase (short-subunit alcohol dehydrogenase family)